MDELLDYGRKMGLNPMDISQRLRWGKPLSDTNWCLAEDGKGKSLSMALEGFETGKYVEYQCYDNTWQPQGRAALQLLAWEDESEALFTADHILASDEYYDYYGSDGGNAIPEEVGKEVGARSFGQGASSSSRASYWGDGS